MKAKKLTLIILTTILLIGLVPLVNAAPTSEIYQPVGTVVDNILELGESENVTITFKNSATADLSDIGSTIQNITISAANLNPTRTKIKTSASWAIYSPSDPLNPRASDTSTAKETDEIYSPESTSSTVKMYTWIIPQAHPYTGKSGEGFVNDLAVLRPQENITLKVNMTCQNTVGDARV